MQTTLRLAPVPRVAWLLVVFALVVALTAVVLVVGSRPRLADPFGLAGNGVVANGAADGDIYLFDPASGTSRPLITGPTKDETPSFSLDGSKFVFARESASDEHKPERGGLPRLTPGDDVHIMGVNMTRIKRTYNLDDVTVRHVREMSAEYGVADSQDAVVELAVERLYREALDRVERERWAAAAADPAFGAEMREIAADLDGDETWPE